MWSPHSGHPHPGSRWMLINNGTAAYPLDGAGTPTPTFASSEMNGVQKVLLEGILFLSSHATLTTTISIVDDGGSLLGGLAAVLPANSAVVPNFVPFGIEGLEINEPIGAKTTQVSVFAFLIYRIIDPNVA